MSLSEITWVSHILKELGVPLPVTPELYCDNLSAVLLTANPAFHSKTKHFTRDHHYVCERVALGTLLVKHIPGLQQIADIFTKSLPFIVSGSNLVWSNLQHQVCGGLLMMHRSITATAAQSPVLSRSPSRFNGLLYLHNKTRRN